MSYIGLWKLVAAKGMDFTTFEPLWRTNEDLLAAGEDDMLKMMADAMFEFKEDGALSILNKVNIPEGTPEEEIEAAIALNVDDNAVLNAAIATAQKAFGEKTATTEVESATTTLKNAETSYSMGSGDITSLGVNMSFEDLSAQGGSMTSSGGPAPYGWNVYING